ncbi:Gentisate 1,2-dioxygenase [compost metagenome]
MKQSARFPAEYSALMYGTGGMMPRFVDHHRGVGGSSPMYVYRYEAVREMLEKHRNWVENQHEGLLLEYVDPVRGGPVYKTMTFFMQMLRPGERTLPVKQSASLLVSPLEGSATATVDGMTFQVEPFDTLAVPSGTWVEYENTSATQPAIVFIASDEPAIKSFGLMQRWGKTASGEVIRLA